MNPVFASAAAQVAYDAVKELFVTPKPDDNDLARITDALEELAKAVSRIERRMSRQ